MKQVDCDQCIHFEVCQFINNNNLSEKDWGFVHDNFIIECKQFKNMNKLKTITQTPTIHINISNAKEGVEVDKIIKNIKECMEKELVNKVEGAFNKS